MEKAVEIRAKSVVKEAIERFVESFTKRALQDEAKYLQNKVASWATLLHVVDGSVIVARIGVVFGQRFSKTQFMQIPEMPGEKGELQITQMVEEEIEPPELEEEEEEDTVPVLQSWCFTNVNENDATVSVLADGRVELQCSELVEIPWPVMQALVAHYSRPVVQSLVAHYSGGKPEADDGAGPR